MYVHLAEVLEEIDFRDRTPGGTNLMSRIRRFMQPHLLSRTVSLANLLADQVPGLPS